MTADFSNLAQSVKTQTQEELANLTAVSQALTESQSKGQDYLDTIDRLIARNGRLNDLLVANFIQEQLKADINHCLACVYNRKEIGDYFEEMMRI